MREIVLITGIFGSGASYMAEYLVNNHPDVEVHGLGRWHSTTNQNNILHIKDRIKVHECDLLDVSSIIRVLQTVKPTKIFSMAAHANVRTCFDIPIAVMQNNVMSTINLFEAVRMVCPEAVVQLCSTSEVYGNPQEFPMKETHQMRPVNVYSASKMSQEAIAYSYHQSWGLKVVITRAFAYWNPRRKDLFGTAFAMQVARIEYGLQSKLLHGNLNSTRQVMDVRDMCRAYWMASNRCLFGTPYNIGGTDILTVHEYLKLLKGFSTKYILSVEDPKLLRPKDVDKQLCDTTKFDTLTGFKPQYSLNESIQWLLDCCREDVKHEK